jgi:hypothetical protein
VAGLEFAVGGLNVAERVGVGDWDLELAFVDQPGEPGEHLGVCGGGVALELDAVLLDCREVDRRIDPVGADAQFERKLDVTVPVAVDERVDRPGLADAFGDAFAIADGDRAVVGEPAVVGITREADHPRALHARELHRDRADAAGGGRDHDGVALV